MKTECLSVLTAAICFFTHTSYSAAVMNCDETSLRAALAADGIARFECDGTIFLSDTIVVSSDIILDATSRNVTLDGNGSVRLFDVVTPVTLRLINVTLTNGLGLGPTGAPAQNGGQGLGGAVRITASGTIAASNCRFLGNRAVGGTGGIQSVSPGPIGNGGSGEGGAIFCAPGQVRLTNCVLRSNSSSGGTGGDSIEPVVQSGGAGGPGYGGAICAGGASIILANCEFSNNSSAGGSFGQGLASPSPAGSWGGSCYLGSGTLTATNSNWTNNSARFAGGAIHSFGSLRFDRCRFAENSVNIGNPSQGGAIYSGGFIVARSCLFANNSALGRDGFVLRSIVANGTDAQGGALSLAFSTAAITNCAFIGNQARGGSGTFPAPPRAANAGSGSGGAIFNQSTLTVLNSTFGFNMANGGTAYVPDASTGQGGAIANFSASRVAYCTIASNLVSANSAGSLGGGCYAGITIDLQGSILAGNMAQGTPNNAYGAFVDVGYNLSSDATPPFSSPDSFNNSDAKLAPLVNFGGPTPVFPLLAGSPALDAVPSGFPSTDQRGVFRPQRGGADIGAFEQTFLRIERLPSQKVRVRYAGVPQEVYTLVFTPDFRSWAAVEPQTAQADGSVTFSDLDISKATSGFLRVRY
jgi:hypothetical protein